MARPLAASMHLSSQRGDHVTSQIYVKIDCDEYTCKHVNDTLSKPKKTRKLFGIQKRLF